MKEKNSVSNTAKYQKHIPYGAHIFSNDIIMMTSLIIIAIVVWIVCDVLQIILKKYPRLFIQN